jgi:pimeloyl-ACP methyl ester carboxylesterase
MIGIFSEVILIVLKYYDVESTKIACWINGRNFGTHKQSLIFIHGSGSDHSAWSQQYAKLHKDYNIVAVDLPGHGLSSGTGETDVSRYCLGIKKLLDILRLGNVIVIGHSLGAAVTLQFAFTFPQGCDGIVVVGGGLKMPVNLSLLELLKKNPAEAIELICKFSLAKDNRSRFFKSLKKSLSAANVNVLHGDLMACDKLDLTEKMKNIKVPALVICGEEDKMMSADFSRQIVENINGAKLCMIKGAGHMAMMERPNEFNDALNIFALSMHRTVK